MSVRAKKHLGQHFLKDDNISHKIANALVCDGRFRTVVEIGPGTGALTKLLLALENVDLEAYEVDRESVAFLAKAYPDLKVRGENFLKSPLESLYPDQIAIAGNFPYNISSQIVFKILTHREQIPEVVGMFQKEVAERICESPGTKAYGILSVLAQAFYDCEYLFTVSEHVFDPPPKVKSGVMRMSRKGRIQVGMQRETVLHGGKNSVQSATKDLTEFLEIADRRRGITRGV